jgi:hypothetical protein
MCGVTESQSERCPFDSQSTDTGPARVRQGTNTTAVRRATAVLHYLTSVSAWSGYVEAVDGSQSVKAEARPISLLTVMSPPSGRNEKDGPQQPVQHAWHSLTTRAGDRTRTGDVQLGKLAFYQLNYARTVYRDESHRSGLNRRPLDYESSALPLSYGGLTRVPWRGLEPRRLSAPPPQDGVSTNFTTRAEPDCYALRTAQNFLRG